jgi:hypothetical protein
MALCTRDALRELYALVVVELAANLECAGAITNLLAGLTLIFATGSQIRIHILAHIRVEVGILVRLHVWSVILAHIVFVIGSSNIRSHIGFIIVIIGRVRSRRRVVRTTQRTGQNQYKCTL